MKKLFNKKGGFKEILYDNVALIIVLLLILTVAVNIALSIRASGEDLINSQNNISNIINGK